MREEPEVFSRYDVRGEAPQEIDSELVHVLGKVLGTYWDEGEVAVGHDYRKHSAAFYSAVVSGLEEAGCDVKLIGEASTDMVALAAKQKYDAGVMVTASHMPPEFCGLKPLNTEGRILSNEEMAEVKEMYTSCEEKGGDGSKESIDFLETYIQRIAERYRELFEEPEEMKAVIDPSGSVAATTGPEALRRIGVDVSTINGTPDPEFRAHSPEPDEEAAQQLSREVRRQDADFGVIFDGDADRAMFVDEDGDFLDGDTTLGIFTDRFMEESSEVVLSVSTSSDVTEHASSRGNVTYTPPGAVFTALECIRGEAVFGGQPNGHLMDRELVPYDSGTAFATYMAGIIHESGELSELQKRFGRNEVERINHRTEEKHEKTGEIREKAHSNDLLLEEVFNSLLMEYRNMRVLTRPSGSEPVVRVKIESEKLEDEDIEDLVEFLELE
jgi:phosphomannomutase